MENYIFYVTSKITKFTLVFDFQNFVFWYDNVWDKQKIMDYYWISGVDTCK